MGALSQSDIKSFVGTPFALAWDILPEIWLKFLSFDIHQVHCLMPCPRYDWSAFDLISEFTVWCVIAIFPRKQEDTLSRWWEFHIMDNLAKWCCQHQHQQSFKGPAFSNTCKQTYLLLVGIYCWAVSELWAVFLSDSYHRQFTNKILQTFVKFTAIRLAKNVS